MKYLHNPITSEVRQVSPLLAKKLKAYGWIKSDAVEHHLYFQQVAKAVVERMPKIGERHRRLH